MYGIGEQDGIPYTVSEYFDAEGLDSIIMSRRSIRSLTRFGTSSKVCHALTYLHENRIVHRNIKPRNILVLKTGAVKIWNFNLAYFEDKGEQPGAQAELQAEGVVPIVGTALYMSPEQVSGVLPPDDVAISLRQESSFMSCSPAPIHLKARIWLTPFSESSVLHPRLSSIRWKVKLVGCRR